MEHKEALEILKKCKECGGKGKLSYYSGRTLAFADFIGDKTYEVDKEGIKYQECSKCKGKGWVVRTKRCKHSFSVRYGYTPMSGCYCKGTGQVPVTTDEKLIKEALECLQKGE